ncbi:MAG: zinc ribbon domain-containing protein [Solirubrobacterales bacterium]
MAVVGPQPPADAPAPPDQPADTEPAATPAPSFLTRGRMRRRLRFVRRAREVALRDLGGLVFDLHRFGRDRHDLVDQKLAALGALDAEMRALGQALDDPDDVTVLREPGLAGCPRCGALHASDARFCSTCGLPVGKGASLPAGPTYAGPAPNPDAPGAAQEPPASGDPRAHEP